MDLTDRQRRMLVWIPILLMVFSSAFLLYNRYDTGEWAEKSIDLTGGTQVTITGSYELGDIEDAISTVDSDASVRRIRSIGENGITIESSGDREAILSALGEAGVNPDDISARSIGPSLGASAMRQGIISLLFAFLFMGVTVFIIFRKFVPSMGIIIGAASDIVGTLAFMQIFGIDLSTVTFAALLLIIGYSIDTDILLTTRVMKGDGNIGSRIKSAMRTGILMSVTTLVALVVLYLFASSSVFKDIASVLMIALVIDIIMTWILNAEILRWWKSR